MALWRRDLANVVEKSSVRTTPSYLCILTLPLSSLTTLHVYSTGLAALCHFVVNVGLTQAGPSAFANIHENYYCMTSCYL